MLGLHQLGRRYSLGSDIDRKQRRRFGSAGIARDPLNRARRLPPGCCGAEGLLGPIVDL